MPLMRADPNYYSKQLAFTTTSTGVENTNVVDLGFPATFARFLNTCDADAWVRFGSSSPATTEDLRIRACSESVLPGMPPFSYLGLYTTATAIKVGVTALGG